MWTVPKGSSGWPDALKKAGGRQDLILLPPVCGVRNFLWKKLVELLDCPVVEMLSIPPGVSGLRLRTCLLNALRELDVTLLENTTVIRADVADGHCRGVITSGLDHEHVYAADQIIVATGGFMGDGFEAEPGKMQESIFQLPLCLENGEMPSADLTGRKKTSLPAMPSLPCASASVHSCVPVLRKARCCWTMSVLWAARWAAMISLLKKAVTAWPLPRPGMPPNVCKAGA